MAEKENITGLQPDPVQEPDHDRPAFTEEDFSKGDPPAVICYCLEATNELELFQRKAYCTDKAGEVGYGKNKFKGLYAAYKNQLESQGEKQASRSNKTDFYGGERPDLELYCGEYEANADGVYYRELGGKVWACDPLMITEILEDIDTRKERVALRFFTRHKGWASVIVPRGDIVKTTKIPELANYGLTMSPKTAAIVGDFLSVISRENDIPVESCAARLGWYNGGFIPYIPEVQFNGDESFKALWDAVAEKRGNDSALARSNVRTVWNKCPESRIVLAAAMASPVLDKFSLHCFVVHLWSTISGSGKTVVLNTAASIWGDPESLVIPCCTTNFAFERRAAFFNHIPMFLDETQTAKDKNGQSTIDLYYWTEGIGKARGTKEGKVEAPGRWKNTILTNGETPITDDSSDAGERNRVIEINLSETIVTAAEGRQISEIYRDNYGHVGKEIIAALQEDNVIKELREKFEEYREKLSKENISPKHQNSAAVILATADFYCKYIDEKCSSLDLDDIKQHLRTSESVDQYKDYYEELGQFVAMNEANFKKDAITSYGKPFGLLAGKYVYIVPSVLRDEFCGDRINYRALCNWLIREMYMPSRKFGKRLTSNSKVPADCFKIELPPINEEG